MLPVAVQEPPTGSYSSADASVSPVSLWPPATSTLPSGSQVAVWLARGMAMLVVEVQTAAVFGMRVDAAVELEVAGGDAAVHPLTANSRAAAPTLANRGVVLRIMGPPYTWTSDLPRARSLES